MNINRHQSGVSMLEVLVALLIVSFGILGTVGMMVNGLKQSTTSSYRSIAVAQVSAMADEMRVNLSGLSSSDSSTFTSFDNMDGSQPSSLNTNCVAAAGCDRNTFLQNSYYLWREQLAAALPSGVGTVCFTRSPALGSESQCPAAATINGTEHYTVKVCWNEQKVAASSTQSAFTGTNTKQNSNGYLCTWELV